MGNPKFLINAGDLVDNGDLEEQWQWMLGLAQEHLMKVPFVPVLGGHEVSDWDGMPRRRIITLQPFQSAAESGGCDS